jgi:hypothetical protein
VAASLSTGLDALYNSRMLSIKESSRDLYIRVLLWLVYATRPLTVIELVAVISVDSEISGIVLESGVDTIKKLLDPLAGLIYISDAVTDRLDSSYQDEARATVQLFHRITHDSILQSGFVGLRVADAHAAIADRCIKHLCYSTMGARDVEKPGAISSPLVDYAADNWQYHLEQARRSNNVAMTR